MVQWLGLGAFTQQAWVQSLVRGTQVPQVMKYGEIYISSHITMQILEISDRKIAGKPQMHDN